MLPKVSVIIPVYNTEKYLRECLDSVLSQSLQEKEIICVDDGSTDNSPEILREYGQKYTNIRILTQKNQFAGVARNRGIQESKGEFLAFLDADDIMLPGALRQMYEAAVQNNLDFIKGALLMENMPTGEVEMSTYWSNKRFKPLWEATRFSERPGGLLYIGDSACNGLYNARFIKATGISFNKLRCSNDRSFFIACLLHASRIMITDIPFVRYKVKQEKSLVSVRAYHFDCQIASYYLCRELASGLPENLFRLVCQRELEHLFYWYFRLLNQGKNIYDMHRILKEFVLGYDVRDVGEQFITSFPWRDWFWTLRNLSRPLPSAKGMGEASCDGRGKRPTVSVILPIYNAQKYLCDAIESVLTQTWANVELICIDDGSTDDSFNIVSAYAAADQRVIVLQQENRGAGLARNRGMAVARGDYITFIDSDDVMQSDYLQEMVKKAYEAKADVVIGGMSYWWGGRVRKRQASALELEFLPHKEVFSCKDIPFYIFNITHDGAIGKLFEKNFIRKYELSFLPLKRAEDFYFVNLALLQAERITVIPNEGYWYRTNNLNSSAHTKDETPLTFIEGILVWKQALLDLGCYQQVKQSFINNVVNKCCYNLRSVKSGQAFFSIQKKLRELADELLELKQHDVSFFYNSANYQHLLKILQFENEQEYVFFSCRQAECVEQQIKALSARNKKIEEKVDELHKQYRHAERGHEACRASLFAKEKELSAIKKGYSFRIGRAITFVPRKLRGGFRCYKEHGFIYTLKRTLWHLGFK